LRNTPEPLRPTLLSGFTGQRDAIRSRLAEFSSVPESEYFYELGYCLLTPQSSAARAGRAMELLRQANLLEHPFDPTGILGDREQYIRFHNTKARRLLEARRNFPLISSALLSGQPSTEIREWLVENVRGLGWKEASHFLRNIGHRNLAILDRHILRNLQKHRVIRRVPESLTKKRYLDIESKFRGFAERCGISIDELDLFFWSSETGEILK